MIKVMLASDSIRMNYGKLIPELLGSEYEVYQAENNCRFAKYTMRGLFASKKEMAGSRSIHYGFWDISNFFGDGHFSTEDEYISNMLRIADMLLAKHEKVVLLQQQFL